jgi:predicted dehydrogenase
MADPAIGGAILGEGCHFVDLMSWLLESEPALVSAFTLPSGKPHPNGHNNLTASFRFVDGSIANLTYCTLGSRTSGGERVEVFGEGIGVSTEDFARVDVRTATRRTRSHWWPDKGYAGLVSSFVEAVRTGKAPAVTARDGSRATIGCLAMLESANSLSPRAIDVERSLDDAAG